MDERRATFRELHHRAAGVASAAEGRAAFLLPNAWDVGSARILAAMGFAAIATTSSGHAASLGRKDQHVTRDELVAHVAALSAAVPLPINVDAERCFAATPEGIAETVDLLADVGAAGISIEDYDPATGTIEPVGVATERVAAAAQACARHGIVLTGRAENLLHGSTDIDDTITRLIAYRDAGAEVLYAPGLRDVATITRVVEAVAVPVNVLAVRAGPTVGELEAAGVRRISTGGSLAFAAYGALARAAEELQQAGTLGFLDGVLPAALRTAAF